MNALRRQNITPQQTFEKWTPRTQESPHKLARQSEAKRKQAPQSEVNVCRRLAYVASVSARAPRERWDESKKKQEWRGRGRGEKETLARKPHDFEKLRSPTNAVFDWWGAASVDYLALETSIKPGMFCLRARASQIWSDLTCGGRL